MKYCNQLTPESLYPDNTRVIIHFNLYDGRYNLHYIYTEKNWLDVGNKINKGRDGLFVSKNNGAQQLQLILDDTPSCWILSFNEAKDLVTIKKHVNTGNKAPISYWIFEPYIIFFPANTFIELAAIQSFDFRDSIDDFQLLMDDFEFSYFYHKRRGDKEVIDQFYAQYKKLSSQELIDTYNDFIKIGGLSVSHYDALKAAALREEFLRRFDESPIYLKGENRFGFVGPLILENDKLKKVNN